MEDSYQITITISLLDSKHKIGIQGPCCWSESRLVADLDLAVTEDSVFIGLLVDKISSLVPHDFIVKTALATSAGTANSVQSWSCREKWDSLNSLKKNPRSLGQREVNFCTSASRGSSEPVQDGQFIYKKCKNISLNCIKSPCLQTCQKIRNICRSVFRLN